MTTSERLSNTKKNLRSYDKEFSVTFERIERIMSKKSLNEARREFEKACDEHVARHGRNAKVYISGPMSNLTREQYLVLFSRAEQSLRAQGYTRIVNPIRVWACRWTWLYRIVGYRLTLLYDLWLLKQCTHIHMVGNDWRQSRGARLERMKAREWGIPELHNGKPIGMTGNK